jgi:hypothetical protein
MRDQGAAEGVFVVHVERHRNLEHARPTRGIVGGDYIRRRPTSERPSEFQVPPAREIGDDIGQIIQPLASRDAIRQRPLPNQLRDVERRAHALFVARRGVRRSVGYRRR